MWMKSFWPKILARSTDGLALCNNSYGVSLPLFFVWDDIESVASPYESKTPEFFT
jgi:hypothetical protein